MRRERDQQDHNSKDSQNGLIKNYARHRHQHCERRNAEFHKFPRRRLK
jgi:hypothetical protein